MLCLQTKRKGNKNNIVQYKKETNVIKIYRIWRNEIAYRKISIRYKNKTEHVYYVVF